MIIGIAAIAYGMYREFMPEKNGGTPRDEDHMAKMRAAKAKKNQEKTEENGDETKDE